MKLPEMSHSAAYHQDESHLVTAYFPDSSPAAPPAAHLPPQSQSLSSSHPIHHGAGAASPSEPDGVEDLPSASSSDPHLQQPHRHSRQRHSLSNQPQASVERTYPESDPVSALPETLVSSPYLENGSILTRASITSEAVRKEGRVRGSWTDHSSYMSGDNHPNGASRAHKRAIQDEVPSEEEELDALVMLFRLTVPVPIFSFCASLYTIFGLMFVILVSPLRICPCIPYFRNTSFRAQLCGLLVPQLHLHERLVCLRRPSARSSSTQPIYDPDASFISDSDESYSIGGLMTVLLLSPFLSLAVLLFAWTAAFFWVFAMALGNPDGTERKDDGRTAVLGVCKWWQIWLRKARRPLG
ncbi:hypothetical protein BO70DRAFT_119279 [Aspergillus heteromorphus CBS 117.55]|uniref:Uncharacterized protein n=1 Tax=Aspergillus heteromorphus CBS 117.55 TaxID=1448321 RepID=A0A317VDV6_9EURO|nr:uncharacterized protein BO70DRAFT_119279 [Aspergillus heteromorphus CBS 117.55]PWY71619.1 hypothetical protein BO70DRAFT_119279 [Aspergillus heteromorphus CBS 117.55]